MGEGIGCSMSSQYRSVYPRSPTGRYSPTLSAVRPAPLSSLSSSPITSSPFTSSPTLSSVSTTQLDSPPPAPQDLEVPTASPPSPDYFDSFDYTPEMDNGVRIIENADSHRRQNGLPPLSLRDGIPMFEDAPAYSAQDQTAKTWVVFHGVNTGIYSDL